MYRLLALLLLPLFASQTLASETPAAITAFYAAVNAADPAERQALLQDAVASDWVTTPPNGQAPGAEGLLGALGFFRDVIPDLTFTVQEVVVAGDRVIVRSVVTGTPAKDFFGIAPSGKSFETIAIDMHTLKDGKIVASFHSESWHIAIHQLSAH